MDYTKTTKAFDRYVKAAEEEMDPEKYYRLCHDLLGCTKALPRPVKAILVDDEGLDEDAMTYHEAAVSALTEQVIDGMGPAEWGQALMPVYEADMAYKHEPASPSGFRTWLLSMASDADVTEALGA